MATPKVYSYLRFSALAQREGASIERQLDYAARWAKKAGMQLDETLRDEGLSAYHQRHISHGALGQFLAAVKDGTVARGSVLIVEQFDRLSRAEPLVAQQQLAELVNAGLTVVTAHDGKQYNRATLKAQPTDLIMSLLSMIRAHEESATKAARVKDAFRRQCQGWVAGTYRGMIRTGPTPCWLRNVGGKFGKWELIPEQVASIRRAAVMYRQGATLHGIARALHADGMRIGAADPTGQNIARTLQSTSLYGEKQTTIDGETFVLEGYYPPVMTRAEWDEVQRIILQRTRKCVRGDIPGVLTGLGIAKCGYCGAPMNGMTQASNRRPDGSMLAGHVRIRCSREQHGLRCVRPGSCSALAIERAIMDYCSDMLNLRALMGGAQASLRRSELDAAESELAAATKACERLTEVMLASEGRVDFFAAKGRELAAARDAAQAKVDKAARAMKDAAVDLTGADKRWRKLVAGVNAMDYDARMTARQLIADTFEAITVYHAGSEKTKGKVKRNERVIDVVLRAKGGVDRALRITDMEGSWSVLETFKHGEPPARERKTSRTRATAQA